MSGITLVFTICSVIIAGAHFALVNGETAPDRPVNPYPLNPEEPRNFGEWGKCYSCERCDKVDNSTKFARCPSYRNSLPGCVSYSWLTLENHDSNPVVMRDCATKLGTCEKIGKLVGVKVLSCTECFTEFCNYN